MSSLSQINSAQSSVSEQPEVALEIEKLSYRYGEKRALDAISLSIKPAQTTILLGPNGAGKTTLFSLICGLFAPHQGSITINGCDIQQEPAQALANLGIVFQSRTLDVDLSVLQNLHYFCALQGMEKSLATQRIHDASQQLGLADRLADKVRTLNGGHQRRVEIMRACLHQPRLLLLDEPTVGLDIPTRQQLVEQLHRLPSQTGAAVLWATHLVDEILPQDRVIILHRGSCVADGSAQSIVQRTETESLEQAFALLTQAELIPDG